MTTTLMRAAVWNGDSAHFEIEQIPIPVPRRDEALVRITACGVCHTDMHVLHGEVAFPSPAVLGHEVSGEIVSFGEGTTATDLQVGDPVVGAFIMPCGECEKCEAGRDDLCLKFFGLNRLKGALYDGESRLTRQDGSGLAMYSMAGFAEYAVVPVRALAKAPEGVELGSAAILGCAMFTAHGAVVRAAELRPGQSVAVVGAGGVGTGLIQMARLHGAGTIIAVDIADEKLENALRLGADHAVNGKSVDAVEAVRALTEGRGVDIAFEAIGHPVTFAQATEMLTDGGRMVAVGIAAGKAAANVEITPLVRRGRQLVGSFGARTREDLPLVVEAAARGDIDLPGSISHRYALEQINEAFTALRNGAITGRALIAMNTEPEEKSA